MGAEEALKRLDALERAVGEPVAVFLPSATASQKRSLMAARRGFLTEQGDMYLPQLAVALRASTQRRSAIRAFTPAHQQAFLYCLLGSEPFTQEGLRELTSISAAGASRALSPLSEAALSIIGSAERRVAREGTLSQTKRSSSAKARNYSEIRSSHAETKCLRRKIMRWSAASRLWLKKAILCRPQNPSSRLVRAAELMRMLALKKSERPALSNVCRMTRPHSLRMEQSILLLCS